MLPVSTRNDFYMLDHTLVVQRFMRGAYAKKNKSSEEKGKRTGRIHFNIQRGCGVC